MAARSAAQTILVRLDRAWRLSFADLQPGKEVVRQLVGTGFEDHDRAVLICICQSDWRKSLVPSASIFVSQTMNDVPRRYPKYCEVRSHRVCHDAPETHHVYVDQVGMPRQHRMN